MNLTNHISSLTGRVLLSAIFISAGASKLGAGYAGTQGYMESMGISGALLPLVIATEILGGLAVLLGFKTRIAAFLLAAFTLLAAVFFHFDFADQMQSILFMKNLAIAGGLLILVTHGGGVLALDNLRSSRV
ncbi:DoxX family protein [Methylophaga sp.]|jgi:putative oxidoreductase|uniref:DoxX family protein n=1 Tax=Methylophaga sp. TaxID=2024840 RepID=UPI0014016D4C|nr:DoxX family protein [Methylophaga sp.]MTI63958.1 DoxX family protein [Methylophaga sp.]